MREVSTGRFWQDLADDRWFFSWRAAKIRACEQLAELPPVTLESLASAGETALAEIRRRCGIANFALYRTASKPGWLDRDRGWLVQFSRDLGLSVSEDHRSADGCGVVTLRTSQAPEKKGYIPYTSRPMNWHTDGYYNPGASPVKAFVLHCHQHSRDGGQNQLIDPEVAYLRMRDENPEFVRAMMHPNAMTIPENRESDGSLRPESTGPVFFADARSGRLQMRYTARTRSIEWRQDPTTAKATQWLREWLDSDEPLKCTVRLEPGQGIVSNNALHNRTAFEDNAAGGPERTILRIRFHERISEDQHGAT